MFPSTHRHLLLVLLLALMSTARSERTPAQPFPLWTTPAPGALGAAPTDIPTLTAYLPAAETANGASMLVLPGGGYAKLAEHEGASYAAWLARQGIAAYVLKYRLGSSGYRNPSMHDDATRALRWVRHLAITEGRDPRKVGVIGSSAGGHLAATLLTGFAAGTPDAADPVETVSSRPDFGILCYPVITLTDPFAHAGSRRQLLGDAPSPELVRSMSAELRVSAETPPCFIWHTVEDATVPVENAFLFASALRQHGVPFELHVFERGAHGLGLTTPARPAPPWDELSLTWMRRHQLIP